MKVIIKTINPAKLKSDIIKMIEDQELQTWSIYRHNNIRYLKHTQQWGEKGVINLIENKPNGELSVEVLKFKGRAEEVKDFAGYYLGRFFEIIFVNFPNSYTSINKA